VKRAHIRFGEEGRFARETAKTTGFGRDLWEYDQGQELTRQDWKTHIGKYCIVRCDASFALLAR
jgi:hypothetical protein